MQDRAKYYNGWSEEKFNNFMDKYFCEKPISQKFLPENSNHAMENITSWEDGTIYRFLWITKYQYKVFINDILIKTGICSG